VASRDFDVVRQMAPEHLAPTVTVPTGAELCEPLLELASPEMYRRNAFRVLGLTTSASFREAAKQLERRRMLAELGQGNGGQNSNRIELRPPASADELRAAEAVLHEPDKRLVQELFWFWPLDPHSRVTDPALQALQGGDLKTAAKCWEAAKQSKAATPAEIAIAKHNIAIRWHLFALDAEEATHGNCWNTEQSDIVGKAWAASLMYWLDAIRSEAIWNTLSARVIAYNDERLSLEFVQSMRGTVGRALLKINAMLALRYAESNIPAGASGHLGLLLKSPLPADNRFVIDEFLITPLKARVRLRIADAEKVRTKAPAEGQVQAENLLSAFSRYRDLLQALEPTTSNGDLRGLCDEVAAQCLSCVIDSQNATGDDKQAGVLLQDLLPLAHADELRKKIEAGITTCKNNLLFSQLTPLLEPLKAVEDDKLSPGERLIAFVGTVEPQIRTVKAVLSQSEELRAATSDRLARALRNISVDAWNLSKDSATAIEALDRADGYAVSGDVRAQIATDRAALAQVYAEQRRAAQTAKNRKYAWGVGITAAAAVVIAIGLNDNSSSVPATHTPPQSSSTTQADSTASSPVFSAASGAGAASSEQTQTYSYPSYRSDELNRDRTAAEQAQVRVNGLGAQLSAAKDALDARQRDADSAKAELDRLGASIEQERAFVDGTDENTVREFNARVAKYNRLLKRTRTLMDQASELVGPYNSLVERYESERREANRLVGVYNSKLEKYGTPR
jgi:hypothetical protein